MQFADYPRRHKSAVPRHERERSRVTLQLTPGQKLAIDWLSRLPESFRAKLPKSFQHLAGEAARTIARELSGPDIRQLVDVRAKIVEQN